MATEAQRLELLRDFYKSSENEHRTFMRRFHENMRFVVGGEQQWDAQALEQLRDEGRPALTWNEILPKVCVLFGEFLENATQVEIFPRRGGTVAAAHILTAIAKHAMDMCEGEFEEAEAFMNGLMGSLGWLHYRRDYQKDPNNGDVVLESRWPGDIIPDESAREYDLNKTGMYLFEQWWWDREQLALAYPKHKNEIKAGGLRSPEGEPIDSFYETQSYWQETIRSDYGQGDEFETYEEPDSPNLRFRYRTRTCWWRNYVRMAHLWDRNNPLETIRLKNKKLKAVAVRLGELNPRRFRIIERTTAVLHKTVQAGQLILEDIEDPYGPQLSRLPWSRFAPYWLGGYAMGAVDNAKDPNRYLNKTISQVLHMLNMMAKNVWFNKKQDGANADELEDNISRTGAVIEYGETLPEPANQKGPPSELFHFSGMLADAMGRIMGVNQPMEGRTEKQDQSGVALQRRILQGTKMARPVFNRYRQTRADAYQGIVELIRHSDVYSEAEVSALLDKEDWMDKEILREAIAIVGPEPQPPREPQPQARDLAVKLFGLRGNMMVAAQDEIYGKAMERYTGEKENWDNEVEKTVKGLMMRELRSAKVGRYGTKVDASPSAPTLRLAYFEQMMNAKAAGIAVPDDVIVEASDWPKKDKIAERLRAAPALVPAG